MRAAQKQLRAREEPAHSLPAPCLPCQLPACPAPTTRQLIGQFHHFKKQHLGKFHSTRGRSEQAVELLPISSGPATAAALARGEIFHPPAHTSPPDLRLPLPSSLLAPGTCWWSPRRSVTPSLPCSSLLSVPWRCLLNLGRGTLGFPSGLNMLAGASTMKAFVTGPGTGQEEGTGQNPPSGGVASCLAPRARPESTTRGAGSCRDSRLPPQRRGRGRAPLPVCGGGERGCSSAPWARPAAQGGAGRPGRPLQSQPSISRCRSRSCLLQ